MSDFISEDLNLEDAVTAVNKKVEKASLATDGDNSREDLNATFDQILVNNLDNTFSRVNAAQEKLMDESLELTTNEIKCTSGYVEDNNSAKEPVVSALEKKRSLLGNLGFSPLAAAFGNLRISGSPADETEIATTPEKQDISEAKLEETFKNTENSINVQDAETNTSQLVEDCKEYIELNKKNLKHRDSEGYTVLPLTSALSPPSHIKLRSDDIRPKLMTLSPSREEERRKYNEYIELKLDIINMRKHLAKLNMEIIEKEGRIIELYPNKVKFLSVPKEECSDKEHSCLVDKMKILEMELDKIIKENKKTQQENEKLKRCLVDAEQLVNRFRKLATMIPTSEKI